MGKIFSQDSVFLLDDTGSTQRDLSAYITEISGLPGTRELKDTPTLGDTGVTRSPGLQNITFTVVGWYDDTATSGPEAVLSALLTHTAAVDFEFGPEGNTGGMPKISGTCWLETLEYPVRMGEYVGFRATFKVEGAITIGTF